MKKPELSLTNLIHVLAQYRKDLGDVISHEGDLLLLVHPICTPEEAAKIDEDLAQFEFAGKCFVYNVLGKKVQL